MCAGFHTISRYFVFCKMYMLFSQNIKKQVLNCVVVIIIIIIIIMVILALILIL